MRNRRLRKIIVYLMLFAMIASTILAGMSMIL